MSRIKYFEKQLGMETMIQAKEARRLLLKQNRRARRKDKSLKRLPVCNRKKRCQTEACPVCRRKFRLNLVFQCERLGLDEMQWTRVSFIPDKMLWKPAMLPEVEIKKQLEALRKRLERSDIADLVMIVGFDLSFNTFENEEVGWQGHYYGLIMAPNTRKLRRAFMEAIKPDPSVERPVLVQTGQAWGVPKLPHLFVQKRLLPAVRLLREAPQDRRQGSQENQPASSERTETA
jgi:hypothetical protein